MTTSSGRRSAIVVVAVLIAASWVVTACGSSTTRGATRTVATCTVSRPTARAGEASPKTGGASSKTGGASSKTGRASGAWPYPNADLANTRDAHGSTISSTNVSRLVRAWTFRLTGAAAKGASASGSLSATPIVRNGVVYLQDLDSDVYAIALASGTLQWEYRCNQPERSGPGPNGVAVADGTVYGLTPTTAFALKATTGRAIWTNRHLLSSGQGTFGIQPQVANGRVYLASQYGSGPGGGVLLALNASNGAELWRFNTVTGAAPGVQSVGLGSGGAWETPLVSRDGSVTYGIGNPYQSPASAMAHPSAELYTDSDVNLDAATGKLRWHYQGVPNDFKDYDMQTSPISASADSVPVVIGSGKMGYVYEMNARTGRLIWKTPVGQHNGHDNDSRLMLEHKLRIKAPYTILPGSLGGVLTNLALAGHNIYVATINLPLTYPTLNLPTATKAAGAPSGQVQALNLVTGQVEWDTKLPQIPVGAATVSNDLVLTTLYDGELIALNRATGAIAYRRQLPTSTNAPIAIAGNTIIVPAGGPKASARSGDPQVVAYTAP